VLVLHEMMFTFSSSLSFSKHYLQVEVHLISSFSMINSSLEDERWLRMS
jgi:hypothetical protein